MDILIFNPSLRFSGVCDGSVRGRASERFCGAGSLTVTADAADTARFMIGGVVLVPEAEEAYMIESIRTDSGAGTAEIIGRGALSYFARRVLREEITYTGSADDINLKTRDAAVMTTLSCDLLFDNVNPMDAFMLNDNPLTGLNIGNLANTAASMYMGYKKQEYSVQRQMEGLFSMISIPQARGVIFFWGSMSFRGLVTQIDNEYTMFNKKGDPIRGIVRMQIQQGASVPGGKKKQVENYDKVHWDNMFDKTFTQDSGSGFLDSFSQATNNSLLNLKL